MKENINKKNIDRKFKLIEGRITSQLVIFALPILLSSLLQQLYNTADAVIVGKFVNADALTGVSQSGKIFMVLTSFFMGISVGAGVIISQYFGSKDKENLSKSVHTTITLSIVFGIFLTVVGYFSSAPLLRLIRVNEEHFDFALDYLRIIFLGVILMFIYNMGSGVLRAVGDSVTPLIFLGVSVFINVILDILFIFILNMGVKGAALATVISQGVAAILVLLRLLLSKEDYKLSIKKLKPDFAILKKIIILGIPMGLQNCVISVAHLIMQYFINSYGPTVAEGVALYSKLDGYIYLPLNSFALALSTFVGQNIGAGKYDRARKAIIRCIIVSEIVTIALGVAVFFSCKSLLYLLGGSDNSIKYGMMFMYVMVISYPILAVNDSLAGALRGAGQATVPAIILISGMCVLRIVFILTFTRIYSSVMIVILSYPVSWVFTTTCLLIYFFKGKRFSKSNISSISAISVQAEES